MNEHDAVEAAFNNGYEKGYADATDNNVGDKKAAVSIEGKR